jgi:putative acetyltransferase
MRIRSAAAVDHAAIHEVEASAFGRPDEADLVDALRAEGASIAELVAEDARGLVVGHVLFTALGIEGGDPAPRAAALAPLAVVEGARRQGIGAALVRHGIEACRALGLDAVVVLGDPAYYGRFGFRPDLAASFASPFPAPYLMALELVPGAIGSGGRLRYAAAFRIDGGSPG